LQVIALISVTNRGEVVCLDVHGMANGNDGPYQDEGKHLALRQQLPMTTGPARCGHQYWMLDMKEACGIWCSRRRAQLDH